VTITQAYQRTWARRAWSCKRRSCYRCS